ncbi:type I secretion C-terminal target domain-containing protein [Roseateles chitosanitabidus]|uniref:type I secretion C-terminal target domain-containing protein n=1 Tax=Roseateles chitosanitabidus TaxID=65048 RepID=UPI000ABB5C73|nr:type I secretion C-terminal target domain-containing protein [Roseateles chitosanitabidus]
MKDTKVVQPTVTPSNGANPINATGTVAVSGLESDATWDYSLDSGTTWKPGTGSSIAAGELSEGANHITIRQTDAVGNQASTSINVAKDTKVSAPTVTPSNGANPINSTGSVAVSGLETGAKWDFSLDNGATWNPGAGSSIAASALNEGTNHITIRQTDTAGNQASKTIDVVKDTQVAQPTITPSNGSDPINSNGSVAVSGLETGAKWDFSLDDGATWKPGTGSSIAASELSEGTNHVTIRQTDLAGNQASKTIDLTKDTQVAAPEVIQDVDGTIRIDHLESGATWSYSVDGGRNWTSGTGSTLPFSALPAIDNTLLVRQTDAAGNSAVSKATFVSKEPLVFSDVTPPEAPSLSLARDIGTLAGDKVSPDATIRVGGLEAGGSWRYSLDGGAIWTTGVGSTIDPTVFGADGDKTVQVKQFDRKGNESVTSTLSFTLSTTTIEQVPLTLSLKSAGTTGQDGLVTVGNAAIHATVPENILSYKIEYDWEDMSTFKTIWSPGRDFDITSLLSDGEHSVRAVIYENTAQGLARYSNELHFVVDRSQSSGALSAAPTLRLATDTGRSNTDLVTSDGKINVTGLAEGASLLYGSPGGGELVRAIGNSIPSSFFGSRDGTKAVTVYQVDAAGKVSEGATLTFTLDTQVAVPGASTSTGTSAVDDGDRVNISGLESGATWEYSLDGGSIWATGTGTSIKAESLNYGDNSVAIRQTDVAGNMATSSVQSVTRNDPAPSVVMHLYETPDQSTYLIGNTVATVHVVRSDIAVATLDDLRGLGDAYGTMSTSGAGQDFVDGLADGAYRFYVASASGKLNEVHCSNAGMTDVAAVRWVAGGHGYFMTMSSEVGTGGDDLMSGNLGVLTGGAGAVTFRATDASALRLFLGDYSRAEGDVLDLSAVLSGATVDNLSSYLSKQVGENGQITLRLDASGSGTFESDKSFVTLLNNQVAQDIALKLAGGATAVI